MSATPQRYPSYLDLFDRGELAHRADRALDAMADCVLCARQCHVDRLYESEPNSFCRTGEYAYVGSAMPHHGEEECLRGRGGSGTIFFTHCNLRCVFCQNSELSWRGEGEPVSPDELAAMMIRLQQVGCHNINLVSPSHVVASILQALVVAVERGLRLPLVYNTGCYDSLKTLELLDGVVDIYMPDFKFWDPEISKLLAWAEDYRTVACQAIKEMHRQVGDLTLDKMGLARRGVLVRHLVLPEHLAGTREVMQFLATEVSRETYVNLMSQYRPACNAHRYPGLGRQLTGEEFREALQVAREAGLHRFA